MPEQIPFWLDSAEIARHEEKLCAELRRFITFGSHALYFSALNSPELLLDEGRLLLPIRFNGITVAVLRLDGVESGAVAPALPLLPDLAGLCLEKIMIASGRDAQTGLEGEEHFIAECEARIMRARVSAPLTSCPGLVVIYLHSGGAGANSAFGQAVQEALPRIGTSLRQNLPESGLAARLDKLSGDLVFGVLFPASSRVFCQKLARRLAHILEKIHITEPLSGQTFPLQVSAGHSLYPHDLSGKDLKLSAFEQALLIRDRARLAARAAWNTEHLAVPATGWAWIPMLCCEIQEMSGLGLVRLNHGLKSGIMAKQRYLVIPRGEPRVAARAKAQIVIRKVRDNDALAEVVHVATAGGQPEVGDGVILIRESAESSTTSGLESQSRFFERLEKRGDSSFILAISRFTSRRPHVDAGEFRAAYSRRLPESAIAGQYGADGIIAYIPGATVEAAQTLLAGVHEEATTLGLEMASGIFAYPFLNFGRDESETCALKALAYAELLPDPHIGCLDAYALAISADKSFSNGDEITALEEYRKALLLNPEDAMLLNSLGVCLAALNRNGEARRSFEIALEKCEEPDLLARISYNLGNIFLKERDILAARRHFRQAVRTDPCHIFAWTRLARTHEQTGQAGMARALYAHAARIAGENSTSLNMIQRQLARLEKESDSTEKAREILHDALVRDPSDTASLLLLAQTYIKEDPAMAESLARKCLALGQAARDVLFEAMAASGKPDPGRWA